MMSGKPSERRIHRYAILVILSGSGDPQCYDDLVGLSGLKVKRFIDEMSRLLTFKAVRKIKKDKNYFEITKKGRNLLQYYRENYNYGDYWKAPWEKYHVRR